MAALIKGTLIKQISKFLKNVTPNQINISTLKGEGEMTNIELDENVLMDLLELPLWLKITSARCNKAGVKVPWTKLKTNPIMISLDKIDLDVEIADPVREYHPEGANKLFDKDSQGAYGFIDKCIDAIQLNIDSVNINIKSNFLTANLNISNIYIFSTTPHWKPASDIRMTRLRDIDRDEIILYKVITWEICRLEAFNLDSGSGTATGAAPTSIKLIMNPSQMQIALKKKLSDKSLVNSKVRVLLNEIYWMANDTQLKAAIGTYTSLSKLMTKAFAQKIKYANLQMSANKPKTNLPQSPLSNANQPPNQSKIDISKVFMHYDIKETSLHLQITNLNIHLYADENYSGNKQIDGGAMQVLFKNLCIDHYPYHKIGSSITHWNNYNYAFKQRDEWSRSILNEFVAKLDSILNKSEVLFDLNRFKLKNHINLLEACTIVTLKDLCIYKVTTNMSDRTANISAMKTTKKSQADSSQNSAPPLRNPNDILHKDNYFIEQQVFDRRPFLSSNYAEFNLPTDETLFANVIFSEFYFPDECNFPLPAPQLFVQCSPIILNIDFLSLLWVNTLMFSLYRQKLIVDESELKSRTPRPNQEAVSTPMQHCDTYIEFITPKMVLSIYPTNKKLDYESKTFLKRPSTIEFGVARLFLTNQMTEHNLSTNSKKFSDLKSTSDRCYELSKSLCNKYGIFKSQDPTLCNLAPCFGDLLKNENCPYVRYDLSFNEDMAANLVNTTKLANNAKEGLFLKTLSRTALNKNPAKDLWTAEFESAWIDFKDPLTNENSTFLENTSFRFYMVNVWDFYSNGRGPMNKTPTSPPSKTIANYKRAYDRLSNLIDLSNSQTNGGVNNTSFDENDSNRDVIASSPVTTKHRAKRRSISGSGEAINMHDYGSTICKSLYSQVNVIGEIKEVHLALNHAQVLFLLRLVDTMDLFMNQLKKDSEHTLKYKSNGSAAKKDATPKIKCLNLEDLPHLKTHTDTSESSSINIALSIKNIELDLMVNDLHKEKLGTIKKEKQEQLFDLDEPESENEPTPAATAVFSNKSSTESPINEERDINKEFVAGYVKFIYGLSSDNPNQSFKFQPAVAGPSAPLRVSSSSSQVMFSAASVDSGIETAKPSSVSSSGNFTVSFSSSSSSSTGISFSKSRASSNAKATTPPGQAPQQQMPNDADLFADDGDNLSLIMSLEADDLINIELGGPPGTTAATNSAAKMSNLLSSRSVSEASVCTAAAATNSSSSTDPSLMKSDSDIQSRPTMKDDESQTEDRKTKVKIKLTNMNVYVQDRDENTLVMARLGRLWLQNRRSSPNSEITIRMRKMPHDLECADGLVELVMENLKLDAYLFTVLGLVELVDDDDDNDNAEKKREAKKSLPVNILIKNSQFNLSDDGEEKYAKFEDDPKLLPLSIERLELSKLSDNRIIIRDIKSTLSSDEWVKNGRLLLSPVGLKKEIDYLNQFKYDLTFIEFNTKFKFQSDKFASLVHLLREAKDANSRLDEEKSRLKKELDKKEAENTSLKQELAKLNESKLDSDYFESALKALREENELLRKGLEKSEDSVNLLKLERERYLQLLNEK